MRSFEQLEGWIRRGRLRRFGVRWISADTIRRQLAHVSPADWHHLLHQIARKLARNRVWPTLGGYPVVAIDGVELCVQHAVTCADCLKRTVNKTTEWYHRIVVASTVGPIRRFVLAWEAVHPRDGDAKQEGEQTGAYRLLDTLFRQYHHQVDIVVADALYASRVFIEAVLQHGWDAVIRLKDDQRLTILRDAQDLKKISKPVQVVKLERAVGFPRSGVGPHRPSSHHCMGTGGHAEPPWSSASRPAGDYDPNRVAFDNHGISRSGLHCL
ncbi:MAG: transposase [Thermaerobacter sp.]|nr:transposase [Thermaerobacter sp.]